MFWLVMEVTVRGHWKMTATADMVNKKAKLSVREEAGPGLLGVREEGWTWSPGSEGGGLGCRFLSLIEKVLGSGSLGLREEGLEPGSCV
jgi:hypothetical protein